MNRREWIDDIAVGALTGVIAGGFGALFLPDPPIGVAILAGGTTGLIIGLTHLPLRAMFGRVPGDRERHGNR